MNVHEHYTDTKAQAYTIDRWNMGNTDTHLLRHFDPFKVTDEAPKDIWYCVDEATTGDYNGYGYIGESNIDVLTDILRSAASVDDDQWAVVAGGYSYQGVWLRGDVICSELIERLCDLVDYCILDSDDASEKEQAAQDEAWENTHREDFHQALNARFTRLDLGSLTDSELDALFYDNEPEWCSEYDSMFVDVDRAAKRVSLETILELFDTWTPSREDEG